MAGQRRLEIPGYETLQFLGNGARSAIWQARDRKTGKLCALKHVTKRPGEDNRFLEQAINEYEIATKLNHPAIRQIYELQKVKRWFRLAEILMVMEYCEGTSVQDKRSESVEENCRIFAEVSRAIAHMGQTGFVHSDMKPNNIIVAANGAVKIIDLGQSCPVGTVKQRIQGTPDFIAPEQVERRPLDGRTDVFNFGATLYWALTGKHIPTVLPSRADTLSAGTVKAVIPPDKLNPNVPPQLSKLVMDCIEYLPASRPQMSEVASKLTMIMRKPAAAAKQATTNTKGS
ncbi:MAG: serine/threonine protein kinase [Planctomycetes bacterium]|nr:serine/threonine protein kinase [Planctomycetota bacterium]